MNKHRALHFLPPQEDGGPRDPGDTIDLSKIGADSTFEIAVGDRKPSRLRVTPEHLLQNSIDRFDAFGDYEYIGKWLNGIVTLTTLIINYTS